MTHLVRWSPRPFGTCRSCLCLVELRPDRRGERAWVTGRHEKLRKLCPGAGTVPLEAGE